MLSDSIAIGKIVAPHGVRGDVRVIPLTDFPERFTQLEQICFDDQSTLKIEKVSFHKQYILLKFRGLDDRNAVESLKGRLISIPKSEVVQLPEGQYYIFDIVGLNVFDEVGTEMGKVTEVLQTGSNDVYVVDAADGNKPILVPALKEVVLKVDIPEGKLIVKLQEEW